MSKSQVPQKLILITGAPGTGKSAVCEHLFRTIDGCAWLDGDWCWMINPWQPKTPAQKRQVEELFSRILRSYLTSSDPRLNTVLFSWVMSSTRMFDLVTKPLIDLAPEIHRIALVCDPEVHRRRMALDGRRSDQANSPQPMSPYYQLGATVIDVTTLTVPLVAARVQEITGAGTAGSTL